MTIFYKTNFNIAVNELAFNDDDYDYDSELDEEEKVQ
jgi:hypothetical protein